MKVFFQVGMPHWGIGLHTAVEQLKRPTGPKVQFVSNVKEADIVVEQAIGAKCMRRIRARGKPYVVHQFCLKTAQWRRHREEWERFWRDAVCVVSYYDMTAYAPRSVLCPLGADFDLFRTAPGLRKRWDLMTTGYATGQEPIDHAHLAMRQVKQNSQIVHVGGKCYSAGNVDHKERITDNEFASTVRQSRWVSCLRWVEGFEMTAAEALASGSRPIMFDLPCYRRWFDGHAVFVPHTIRDGRRRVRGSRLVEDLSSVLLGQPEEVTDEERETLRRRFGWRAVANQFWSGILEHAA